MGTDFDLRPPRRIGGLAQQAQRGARIGVGYDHRRMDALAALQLDTLAGQNAGHRHTRGHHRAQVAGDIAKDKRHHPHAPAHVAPGSGQAALPAARVVEVHRGRAFIERAGKGADHALAQVGHLQTLVGQVALDVVHHRPVEHQADRLVVALEPLLDLLAARRFTEPQVGRRKRFACRACRTQRVAGTAHHIAHRAPAGQVLRRKAQQLGLAGVVVLRQLDVAAILERHEHAGSGGCPVIAPGREIELLDHQGMQQPAQVRTGRDREARPGLLQRAGAADPLAGFQHQHFLAGARKVGGAGQSVVARADHDDVPALGGQVLDGHWQADATKTTTS